MSENNAIDRFYAGLATGDVAAIRAALTPGMVTWHSFDRLEMDFDATIASLEGLIAHSKARGVSDVEQEPIAGGVLRRQTFWIELPNGDRKAWPVALIVRIEGDKVARIDEYIDRASGYSPD